MEQDRKDPSTFYTIPKIHKPTLGDRPISATHSYMLVEPSSTLSSYLQMYVERHEEIAINTTHVFRQLEKKCSKGALF